MSAPFIAPSTLPSPAASSRALAPTLARPESVAPRPGSGGFDAALAAFTTEESTTAQNAEGLVGTRIRAPEGGCGCDALVAAAMPKDEASGRVLPTAAIDVPAWSALSPARLGDVIAGDVLLLSNDDELTGRLHQAIVRNATEMIAANRNGMIEVLSIPWARVAGVR